MEDEEEKAEGGFIFKLSKTRERSGRKEWERGVGERGCEIDLY